MHGTVLGKPRNPTGPQTPSVYHCTQILFGRESDQNLKSSKTTNRLINLLCNSVESMGLFKYTNYMLLSVTYIQISDCFGNKVVQRMYTGSNLTLCLGFPDIHWALTGVLVPSLHITVDSQI